MYIYIYIYIYIYMYYVHLASVRFEQSVSWIAYTLTATYITSLAY